MFLILLLIFSQAATYFVLNLNYLDFYFLLIYVYFFQVFFFAAAALQCSCSTTKSSYFC